MHAHACSWSKCKWLILVLPMLALSGCGKQDSDQARELRTRMDEAQVRIEAQATQIARLERTLRAAGKAARQADLRRQASRSAQASRTQQLKALQQQRQALLLDQRNLRQALTQSNAMVRRVNQQLLFVGQQNRYLRARVNTLDAWFRQQAIVTQTQSRELAALRQARNQTSSQRQKLAAVIADREARLARLQSNRSAVENKVRLLNSNLATAIDNGLRLRDRIDKLQRARLYLADKLAAAENRLTELQNTPK